MAWTAPRTWVQSELVTPALLNTHLRDQLLIEHANYATSLPGSPSDSQIAILVDSTSAPTYRWHLRYNSSISTAYKWEFIGGTELVGPSANLSAGNLETYRFLTTTNLTVPVAGIYDVILVSLRGTSSGRSMFTVGVDQVADDTYATGANGTMLPGQWAVSRRTLAAGNVLNVAYRGVDTGVFETLTGAHVRLKPVQIG